MIILRGSAVSQKIQTDIENELVQWDQKKVRRPHLTVVLVGEDPASEIYVSRKEQMCKKLGFTSEVIKLAAATTQTELQKVIQDLNQNLLVDGILVQLPLPAHMNSREVLETIQPQKDVDCLTERNLGKILTSRATVQPCTPSGVIEILKFYDLPIRGKNVAIIGRSLIVGIPLIHLLLKENASVTVFHSHSEDVSSQLKNFDIVCVAVGQSGVFKYSQFKPGAILIDVGINRNGSVISGDIHNDLPEGSSYIHAATPVPGGVGVMTIAMLMKNTLALARSSRKI